MMATRPNTSTKTKSMWQSSLSKLKNHFWNVHVKWINLPCITNTELSTDINITVMGTILRDGEFQLTEYWLAKTLEEAQNWKT